MHSYLGVASFKSAITIPAADSTDDTRLRSALESASRQIDGYTQRTFRVYTATKVVTASNPRLLLLPADLLAVTTLSTDDDGDRVYENSWATTDYDLCPDNAADEQKPYWYIHVTPDGDYYFPASMRRGVRIVGRWGYWQDLLALAATTAEALDASETGIDMSGVSEVEVGQTLLIDSEQVYITAISGTTLTVERGVNGTTAATHLTGAAVSLYRYHPNIVDATRLVAARLFQRVHAPFGIVGSSEMGTTSVIMRNDPDVKALLLDFVSGSGMFA